MQNERWVQNKNKKWIGWIKVKDDSLISVDDEELSKAKEVHKKIRHKEFVDVLFNKKVIRHKIGTYNVSKISLSCFDDERYVLDDGGNSLAYFYKDIIVFIRLIQIHKIDTDS